MRQKVKQRHKGGGISTENGQRKCKSTSNEAQQKIKPFAEHLAKEHNDRVLPADSICLPITIIVQDKQGVDNQTTSNSADDNRQTDERSLQIKVATTGTRPKKTSTSKSPKPQ